MSADSDHPYSSNDGIYVLRTTQQNQVQLNLMADQKANIVIGVSLIFFTVAQRQLVNGLGENELLILPLIMLATAMFGSFLLSVLVLAPKMRATRPCKPEDLTNPLFFGSFRASNEDDYTDFLLKQVDGIETSRRLLIRDIHQTGSVLHRKYRFLRLSYICLTTGVIVSALSTIWILVDGSAV
ncbi:MAG: DUF5706 domain-containing protein [Verrucomicrobiales bacterium]|nr:DUF5706 domain-containing protein [Verrucomicrobiales bacterium]